MYVDEDGLRDSFIIPTTRVCLKENARDCERLSQKLISFSDIGRLVGSVDVTTEVLRPRDRGTKFERIELNHGVLLGSTHV